MIDPITEQILLEDRALKSLRMFMTNMKTAISRKDIRKVARLSNMLPEISLKSLKKWAIRLPNFRKNYDKAKRAVRSSKIFDKQVEEPASVVVAVIASSTNKTCAEVLKRGVVGMPQAKVLSMILPPGSQFVVPLLKLNFFVLAAMSVYITGGDIIMPAVVSVFQAIGYLLGLAGKGFKAIGHVLSKTTDQKTTEQAVEDINKMLGTDLAPPKVLGLKPELVEKMKQAGVEFGPMGGEHLPGTAGLFFKTKK